MVIPMVTIYLQNVHSLTLIKHNGFNVSKLSKLIGIIDTTFIASIFYLIFATQNLKFSLMYKFVEISFIWLHENSYSWDD